MSVYEEIMRIQKGEDWLDNLQKSGKDKSKLVPVQKQVSRGGKTFQQTVWVSPEDAKKEGKKNKKEDKKKEGKKNKKEDKKKEGKEDKGEKKKKKKVDKNSFEYVSKKYEKEENLSEEFDEFTVYHSEKEEKIKVFNENNVHIQTFDDDEDYKEIVRFMDDLSDELFEEDDEPGEAFEHAEEEDDFLYEIGDGNKAFHSAEVDVIKLFDKNKKLVGTYWGDLSKKKLTRQAEKDGAKF